MVTFTPENKIIGDEKRSFIRQSLLERISLEWICRIFNVSLPWLLQFITGIIEELPEDLNAVITNADYGLFFIQKRDKF